MAYKVFTNGSVLNASEINQNLMQQATATFSNAAARTAAITSPVEGQLTYLEDSNLYASWNGSSWVSPFGMTLLNNTTFTSTAAVTFDNLFSSTYDNYQVLLSGTSASAFTGARINFRLAGVDVGGGGYSDQVLTATATSVSADRLLSQGQARIGNITTNGGAINLTIFNPALAERSFGLSNSYHQGNVLLQQGFEHNVATAYDGMRITFTSNSTGRVQIYGIRK